MKNAKKNINDGDLLELLRLGNPLAIDHMIDAYGGLVLTIVRRYLKDDYIQDECINDIWLAIWHNHTSYNQQSSFKNWLAAISKYKAIDYRRKLDFQDSHYPIVADEEMPVTETQPLDKGDDAGFYKLIEPLKEKDQALFIAYYIDGMSIEDLSRTFHLSQSQLYNHLSRGKKRIKAKIKEV